MTPDDLAQAFHEAYERLAPHFGYKTREASAKPWADVPLENRALMAAVCAELLADLGELANLGLATTGQLIDEIRSRVEVDYFAGGGGLEYTTVRGRPRAIVDGPSL